MVKMITKFGNSHGLVLDAALMNLVHLKAGDSVNISIHSGGSIILTPVRPAISPAKAATTAKRLIRKNSELFRRLS